jgi:hypothetical protein
VTDQIRPDVARTVAVGQAPSDGVSIAYESPEAVLADDTLSAAQKGRFLDGWRAALAAHLAGDEVAAADTAGEADLVRRIDCARAAISG